MGAIYTLSQKPVEGARHLCVIATQRIEFTPDFSGANAIIFSSQNAVDAVSEHVGEWRSFAVFTVGEVTAASVRELGVEVLYSHALSGARELSRVLAEQYGGFSYIYVRPEKSAFDIESYLLSCGIPCRSLVVYRTECAEKRQEVPPDGSIIVFSSPSTVECFMRLYGWSSSYKAVAIGKTTLAAMPEGITAYLSPKPTLAAAVEFAASISV